MLGRRNTASRWAVPASSGTASVGDAATERKGPSGSRGPRGWRAGGRGRDYRARSGLMLRGPRLRPGPVNYSRVRFAYATG